MLHPVAISLSTDNASLILVRITGIVEDAHLALGEEGEVPAAYDMIIGGSVVRRSRRIHTEEPLGKVLS